MSSRKEANVKRAVKELRGEGEGVEVEGVTCHVGKSDHRTRLIEEVLIYGPHAARLWRMV